jgi:hypothetical protein
MRVERKQLRNLTAMLQTRGMIRRKKRKNV